DVREAAVGMGYTRSQVLWRVELPLAAGVMGGGLRVATVTIIGLTTVTAWIGQGGLGRLIYSEGIQQFFSTPLIIGALLSVVLAVGIDAALVVFQDRITPWAR